VDLDRHHIFQQVLILIVLVDLMVALVLMALAVEAAVAPGARIVQ
jgi:hypothetical protein